MGRGNSPEFGSEQLDGLLPVPEDPIRSIERVEQRVLAEEFQPFRDLLLAVELLGTDDARRMSYHKYYLEGATRQLLFYGNMHRGVGRTLHVIINDDVPAMGDCRNLYTREYIVNTSADIITKTTGFTWRSHHQEGWNNLEALRAPFLLRKDNKVKLGAGDAYQMALPYERQYSAMELMQMRTYVDELTDTLSPLNEITRENGVTN